MYKIEDEAIGTYLVRKYSELQGEELRKFVHETAMSGQPLSDAAKVRWQD